MTTQPVVVCGWMPPKILGFLGIVFLAPWLSRLHSGQHLARFGSFRRRVKIAKFYDKCQEFKWVLRAHDGGSCVCSSISNYAKNESYGQQGEFFDASEYECQ